MRAPDRTAGALLAFVILLSTVTTVLFSGSHTWSPTTAPHVVHVEPQPRPNANTKQPTARPKPKSLGSTLAGSPRRKNVRSSQAARTQRANELWLKTLAWNAAVKANEDYHAWYDWRLWHAVGICEQSGPGADGIAWHGSPAGGLPGSGYPGGLGLSRDFWRMFAPRAGVMVSNGALASPADQIRVARVGSRNGTAMNGWSSWRNGCVRSTMQRLR